jgi:hypothetical protein
MKQVIIENPVINSPFEEPKRHFRFADDGITNEIVEGRRESAPQEICAKKRFYGKRSGALGPRFRQQSSRLRF